jgi:hypothetical protein
VGTLFQRDAVSRARQFLSLAERCSVHDRDQYEMFLEAAIVFARAALLRLKHQCDTSGRGWSEWWNSLTGDEAVEFLRRERDFILKQSSARVNQVIRVGQASAPADRHYYFGDDPDVSATSTIARYLSRIEEIVGDGLARFGKGQKNPTGPGGDAG